MSMTFPGLASQVRLPMLTVLFEFDQVTGGEDGIGAPAVWLVLLPITNVPVETELSNVATRVIGEFGTMASIVGDMLIT